MKPLKYNLLKTVLTLVIFLSTADAWKWYGWLYSENVKAVLRRLL